MKVVSTVRHINVTKKIWLLRVAVIERNSKRSGKNRTQLTFQNQEEDFFNFFGLLKKPSLYYFYCSGKKFVHDIKIIYNGNNCIRSVQIVWSKKMSFPHLDRTKCGFVRNNLDLSKTVLEL
jgi:hypothetical protein